MMPIFAAVMSTISTLLASKSNHAKLVLILHDATEGLIRIVIKQTSPILPGGLRQQFLLGFQGFNRIETKAHDPPEGHGRSHRHQITKAEKGFATLNHPAPCNQRIVPAVLFQ